MKIYSALLAAALFFAGMATMKVIGPAGAVKLIAAPAIAAPPSGPGATRSQTVPAGCIAGFGANPGNYAASATDVKYQCTSLTVVCPGTFTTVEVATLQGPARFQYACIKGSTP